ncbi:MAG: hypothetical protein KDA90_13920 [Planctomycetaceae bacterium]|nr:hypothetical protein [Planctomycetaceae bacterium]
MIDAPCGTPPVAAFFRDALGAFRREKGISETKNATSAHLGKSRKLLPLVIFRKVGATGRQ